MRINENNYVDKAEEAIIELVKDAKERYGVRYRDKLVTTSRIKTEKQRKSRYGYDFQTPKPSGDDSRYL